LNKAEFVDRFTSMIMDYLGFNIPHSIIVQAKTKLMILLYDKQFVKKLKTMVEELEA